MDAIAGQLRDFHLKTEQEQAVRHLCQGKDVLAVLPTGFGKSRIYQAFSSLKSCENTGATLIVIAPLTSIIEDQLADLRSRGIRAAALSSLSSAELEECSLEIILCSAEEAISKEFTSLLKRESCELHQRVCCIVVDECHTVETWTGKRKNKSKRKEMPFRSAYGKLATLRSLCKEGVPVLALTGTADRNTQKVICKELVMSSPEVLFVSPNRQNLRISVTKLEKSKMHYKLDWIVEMTKRQGADTPKTIIFCNTLQDIAIVVNHLMVKLGKYAFYPQTSTHHKDLLIGIFHSTSWPHQKELILKSLSSGNGLKRIVVASTALSMGVNFPDIRYVLNWGPARTLLDYHQEGGRAGRDGQPAHVVTVYYGQQTTNCDDEVKQFVNAEGCLRVAAYKPFDDSIMPLDTGHKCCINCSKSCSCDQPECKEPLPFEKPTNSEENVLCESMTRPITVQDKDYVRDAFSTLSTSLPVACSVFGKTASHGFSDELVESICQNCHKLFTLEDINSCLPVYSVRHALKILEILDETFEDIPSIDVTKLLLQDILEIELNDYSSCEFEEGQSESDPEYEEADEMLVHH